MGLLRQISVQEEKAEANRRVSETTASHHEYEKCLKAAGEHLLTSLLALRQKHHFLLLGAHFHVQIRNNICQTPWKQTLSQ